MIILLLRVASTLTMEKIVNKISLFGIFFCIFDEQGWYWMEFLIKQFSPDQ